MSVPILDSIRASCRWVAERARFVAIRESEIARYAGALPPPPLSSGPNAAVPATEPDVAAFWLTMDAVNFGSGWFPTLKKRSGRSGYHTIHDGLRDRFDRTGAWTAAELAQITPKEMAATFGQDPSHQLMGLFAESLRDLGRRLSRQFDGSFTGPVEVALGSAERLVEVLAAWDCFADSSSYAGREITFLKRAQIAAADLHRSGAARFSDLRRLTMFADNLVPHVLRLDGILEFDPALVARIDAEELIEHGSPEEVEIRACAVHAVELIVAASHRGHTAADIDQRLWHRGQEPRYKASPRHRSRCTAY
jgi:hypothetical protein